MKLLRSLLAGLALVSSFAFAADPPPPSSSGFITTQNLVPAGVCTASSCVELTTQGVGTVAVQVTGTYTGVLSGQATVDGTTWVTLSAASAFTNAAGTATATIGSGNQNVYSVTVAGYKRFRVTGLAAMTGTATVTIQGVGGGGGGGGSGGGGGAVTIADGSDAAEGATTDVVCTTDTGTCTVIALLKKIATNINATDAVSTATLTNVSASASNVTCLASNAARKRAIILNDSATATLYVKAGATASTTSHTWQLAPGATLTLDNFPVYTGILDCIWSAASGSARVTEF